MAKKYHRVPWLNDLDGDKSKADYYVNQTERFILAETKENANADRVKYKVSCYLCNEVLFKAISEKSWQAWLSTREQRHFDSNQHRYNVVLDKLAGDAQE